MPHRISVAMVIKEMTIIIKGLAHEGYDEEDWQLEVPDSVTTVFPLVTAADKNSPWANTCGDGSAVGYTITLAAGLHGVLTKAVTDTGGAPSGV
jgi:hypothetical protein